MASINEMRAERARIFEQAKALVQRAKDEDRDLNGEEQAAWDDMNADIDRLAKDINDTERQERIDAVRNSLDPDTERTVRTPEKDFERKFGAFLAGETRSFEINYTSADLNEKRDLLAGTGTGANLVPISFVRSLREHLIENSAIRQTNATVLTTTSGEELRVPKTTAHPGGQITTEGSTITANDPTFAQATLNAYKYTNLTSVSREFIEDEIVNVLEYLARHNGIALANLSGADFVNGDGSGNPQGVVDAATSGKTAAATDAITAEELIDLQHSVVSGYRRNSYWLMNDSTAAHVRKLRDESGGTAGTGQFLWQPGLQQGQPDMLLGRPVVTDPGVPELGTSNKTVVFGDFSGYYIRDVGSVRFERSDDFAFDSDMVTFRAIIRTDGELVDENAVRALTQDDGQ
jgi:HK97 family phage major capsid protein